MTIIDRSSLLSLEAYAKQRPEFRKRVLDHKRYRMIQIGDHVTLHFEDELTVRYQIQEMLRAERTFEEEGIQNELDAYNPLIPNGRNLKATMMLEFPDPAERAAWLARLIDIEDTVWLQVADREKVSAIADEDLDRETESKTSAVHFLRFELSDPMIREMKAGSRVVVGIEHPEYNLRVELSPEVRSSLARDFDLD